MGSFNKQSPAPNVNIHKLNSTEIKFLLQFLAASAFKGENIKILHNIVSKLEKQLQHG